MRTYGRNPDTKKWGIVETDPDGNSTYVWITTLVQVLKLSIGESPFFGNFGIPAQRSVVEQIFPDYYVLQVQSQFAQYFASLIIQKVDSPTPTYNIRIITFEGTKLALEILV